MKRLLSIPLFCAITMTCALATAQTPTKTPTASSWDLAVKAEQGGELDRALRLYERAYVEDRKPRAIYRRVLIYERQKRYAEALELLQQNRAALNTDSTITDLPIVEQRIARAAQNANTKTTPKTTPKPAPSNTLPWVVLGTGAAAIVGGAALSWSANSRAEELRCAANTLEARDCDTVYPQLSTSERDTRTSAIQRDNAIGLALAGVGVAAVGWSVYSLITAAPATNKNPEKQGASVRVSFGREATMIGISGSF